MLARGKDGDLDSWMPADPSSLQLHFNTFKQYVCSMSTLSDALLFWSKTENWKCCAIWKH